MSQAERTGQEAEGLVANHDDLNVPLNINETFADENSSISSPSLLPQVIGGGVAALVQVGLGTVAGYSGVTIPLLTHPNSSDLILDQQQVALFSSVVYLAAAAGCLIGILPMVWFGQRVIMLSGLPILFAGWMTLAFSTNIWMLQTSRVIIGLTIGVIESASYQYTTEIAHSTIRGQMVGTLDTMRQLGVMFMYALGITSLGWKEMALVCGCTTTIPVFIALIFLPESPRWLATRGRLEEASKSLSFYRGSNYNIGPELSSITNQLNKDNETKKGILDQLSLMKEKSILYVICVLALLVFAVQFTGNIVVLAYCIPIFEVAKVDINSYISAVIVGGIRVVGTICSLIFVDRVGRRPALIISFLICGTSLIALGLFFYLKSKDVNMHNVNWLPLTSMVIFTFFTCVGHPTLNLVRGELLPTPVRSAAMPILFVIFFGGMFLASHTFPMMASTLGVYGAFWVYAAVSIFIVITVALIIPETCNEDLENITLRTFGLKFHSKAKYSVS